MADTPKQLTTIKDANGKEFSIDLTKISDINGDLGDKSSARVADTRSGMLTYVHDMEIVDCNGQVLDSAQLIKDMSSGKTNVTSIDVEMEATHSGKNLNYCIYYEDSMEKDAETFMNPYHKPMLKNHNDYSGEPLGRIKQSTFGPSQLTDERSAIHLTAHVTDQDAIPKFIDGRYATVSIGGSMGTVTCNVCGKTILKNGKFKWCGHWRGETYKDSVCYWGARDITYHEVSTVNNPADVYAQVMKITVHTDSDENNNNKGTDSNNNNKEEGTMGETNKDSKATDAATAKKSVCDIIDQLLNTGTESAAAASDNNDQGTATDSTGEQASGATATDTAASTEGSSAEDNNKLKKDLEDAQAKVKELETQLADAQKNLETAQQEAKDAKEQAEGLQDKCIALATANKELVADSLLANESFENDAAKDARKKELMAMSMKDLNKLAESATATDTQRRTPGKVTNPTMAGEDPVKDDSSGSGTNTATDSNKNNNKPAKTVDDFAQDIVGKLLR